MSCYHWGYNNEDSVFKYSVQTQLKTPFGLWLSESVDTESIPIHVDMHLVCFLRFWDELWLCNCLASWFPKVVLKWCLLVLLICEDLATWLQKSPVNLYLGGQAAYFVSKHREAPVCLYRIDALFIYFLGKSSVSNTWGQGRHAKCSESMTNFRNVHDRLS